MTKRPFWDYDLEETLTDEAADMIAGAIYRAWTGEEMPELTAEEAAEYAAAKNRPAAKTAAPNRPFWAYDLEDTLTDEQAAELAGAVYRSWTGEEMPKADAQNSSA